MKKKSTGAAIACLLLIGLLPYLSGCSTHTAALDSARASYARASADPVITANAPTELYEARQSLDTAEKADGEAAQRHYAYLAERQTEQARYQAERKGAEQRLTQLAQERQQVQLQAREQETERARELAMNTRRQAEAYQQQAYLAEQRARTAQEQQARAMGQAQAAQQQAQLAQQQSDQLKSQLSELKAQQTKQGNVMLTMGDVMFATDKATINPGAMLSIDKLADILKQNANERVYIEGHTDNTGSADYNQQLSTARANAVREALIQRGISPDRITARGLGESFPVAGNDTQAGRQLNRRVDIIISG